MKPFALFIGLLAGSGVVVCTIAAAGLLPDSGAKRIASDAGSSDSYGDAVAIDGDYAIVGAALNSENGGLSGAAYILERDAAGAWGEVLRVLPSDGELGDFFGFSVALHDETAIIGAEQDNGPAGINQGSAYVYIRNGAGIWEFQEKLISADGSGLDLFGFAVAIDVDTALVTCMRDDDGQPNAGSVYVYVRDGLGVWSFQDKLLASDGATSDAFGGSLALLGDDAAAGAPRTDDLGEDSGSVYVYERDGLGDWSEVVELTADDGAAGDLFGIGVALVGDLLAVGSPFNDENGSDSGAVYLFERDGLGDWMQTDKLMSGVGAADQLFGSSVSISGGVLAIGASGDAGAQAGSGAVYLFELSGGSWTQVDRVIASDGETNDAFGGAIGVDGQCLLVGAGDDDDGGLDAGAVYFFDLCLPDINGDGVVDTADLGALIGAFGSADAASDLYDDGIVDTADLGALIAAFGSACP